MHLTQNPKSKIQYPKSLRVLYFIGSYGPEAMGSASHEQTILALRDRGHHVDVLTQINRPDVGRYTRVEYEEHIFMKVADLMGWRLTQVVIRNGKERWLHYERAYRQQIDS